MLDLPVKNKNGISKLSYSQINLFKNEKREYYKRYILKEPFKGNAYTDFGTKVGTALEHNDFTAFDPEEKETLQKCTRLDVFEKKININFDQFVLVGYIDSISDDLSTIIDYKTGGAGKESNYLKDDYTQLCLYALGIRQEYGITPDKAYVNFIRREGNAFRGQKLKVGKECLMLPIDITYNKLKSVYWETIKIAHQIEFFYQQHRS
tara:strand:+ start:1217 stop:1837 length:621 start_codon:yes stop_codon:yes gene_type:complete